MMKFEARQIFVSYTQQGVFLDTYLMDKLVVGEDDVVEMKMYFEGKLASGSYSLVKAKEKWDLELEKSAYEKGWYSHEVVEKFLRSQSCIVVGYVDWNNLTLGWDIKNLLHSNPTIELKKYVEINHCKRILLKILAGLPSYVREKAKWYEYSDVISEKQEIVLWCHTDKTKKKPIDLKRISLKLLPLLGSKRRAILMENGINTILELISTPLDKLRTIKGISYDLLEKWIFDSSKALCPSAHPLRCQVFLTEPRDQKLVVTKETDVDALSPYYSQFFVRGHPRVESKILDALHERFEDFYTVTMPREGVITLLRKDGTQEVNIFGPWIIGMFGFKHKNEAKDFLQQMKVPIQSTFEAWDAKDVVQLIKPQETHIEADQILESLVRELSVQYADPKQILREMEFGGRIVVDTSILIDGRLSSLIVRAMQGTLDYSITSPEIIIPNIVSYEIKSMIDRPVPKEVQYHLADKELLKLKALHDAGYINLKYVGEIPQLPPIMQHEKGTWKFFSSLRDEYILRVLEEVEKPTIITQDGRLARSAYIRGFDVIHIKPLIREIKDEFGQEIKKFGDLSNDEQEHLLIEIGDRLLVSKDTITEILKLDKMRVTPEKKSG